MTAVRPEHEYDPLTDPLPPGGHGSPWFRADNLPPDASAPVQEPVSGPVAEPLAAPAPEPLTEPQQGYEPGPAAYQQDWYPAQEPIAEPVAPDFRAEPEIPVPEPIAVPSATAVPPATGGRAERRRAAKGKGRAAPTPAPEPDGRRLTRAEARRAAKARKDSAAVIASRVLGEAFITLGVVMLLFVTYQLWWTNVRAHQEAGSAAKKIAQDWADGRKPGTFAPGQGFAIMHIPKLDIVAPIAQGTSKAKVLDKGMIGHYDEGSLKTAMPADATGNFAVAAHRNTHGEPFRYINRLKAGDKVVVETQDAYYTYEITSELPQTSPANVSVLKPIPVGSGFTKPGRYLTLTTCTPEFTSTYRLIVWGKMVDDRPRSKGKPDALVE
ncbi:class E sortase [Streptomyces sp. NBC_00212]|uniref:class E sortase n=1 Tax=Streptomyces sp. NBC_00212 TaxID=2975684 RepID=UPI00324D490C